MAEIIRKDGKRGTTWKARYRDPSGRRRAKSFPTKRDAQRFLDNVRSDMHRGRLPRPRSRPAEVRRPGG